MKNLIIYLSQFTLNDALLIEKTDRQFQALEGLYQNLANKEVFLPLIIANSTVAYLLSSSGESYWEEFCLFFGRNNISSIQEIIPQMIRFLPQSTGNKRLQNHKKARLGKLEDFLDIFQKNEKVLTDNLVLFRTKLSQHMKQKENAKTIVYTIKMLSYGIRIKEKRDIIVPFEISIPIDSRLIKLYQRFNTDPNKKIEVFYQELSEITNIPPIHLDGILWTNYQEILGCVNIKLSKVMQSFQREQMSYT